MAALARPSGSARASRRLPIDDLDRAIVNLTARINASTYELLVLIREFDERAGWVPWGFESCAEWLHWRCDLSPGAAREKVRVAHALKQLPEISIAFSEGELSYSKVRALTRVATPEQESSLLRFARSTTASRVEERCQQIRNALPDSVDLANRAHERRSLRVSRDPGRGTMTMTVELPIETGELVCRALDQAVEADARDAPPFSGPERERDSWSARQADALVTMARVYLNGEPSEGAGIADAHQVVVHVDGSALLGDGDPSGLARSDLSLETVRRLCCDGSVVPMADGLGGEPLCVGRKQRTVTAALRRALWARDRGCAFPGCTHKRWVAAHHVRHWVDGGTTSIDNTILLCSAHHRLVHEGGYEIRKDYQGSWYFRRSDGRAIPCCGYQPDDMIDDTANDIREEQGPFARRVPAGTCLPVGHSASNGSESSTPSSPPLSPDSC